MLFGVDFRLVERDPIEIDEYEYDEIVYKNKALPMTAGAR